MKNILYILIFFISSTLFSQQKVIEISNIKTGETKVIEANQAVKIRTLDKKKHIGNLSFSDDKTLLIGNESIKIDSLLSIKRNPEKFRTIKKITLIAGLATIGASIVAASTGSESALLIFGIGSGITISAGILEGLNTNYSNTKWAYKIIEK